MTTTERSRPTPTDITGRPAWRRYLGVGLLTVAFLLSTAAPAWQLLYFLLLTAPAAVLLWPSGADGSRA